MNIKIIKIISIVLNSFIVIACQPTTSVTPDLSAQSISPTLLPSSPSAPSTPSSTLSTSSSPAASLPSPSLTSLPLSPLSPYQDWAISITKNSLKTPFILMTTEIQGAPLPIGIGLNNKIVYFEKKGSSIFLFEYSNGKILSSSLDTQILLTEFPILSESENQIHFDFKKGMDQIFRLNSIYLGGGVIIANDNVIKINKSFIKKIENKDNNLIINETIRADFPSDYKKIIDDDLNLYTPLTINSVINLALELKIVLMPYKPNATFPIKEKDKYKDKNNFDFYFETHPKIDSSSSSIQTLLMRQNISNNITYYLSKEIPTKYVEAVKEGILYWNKVFNKEIIKVESSWPKNVELNDPGYNLIKWINFSTGNFSYSDISADPMTGEILKSTIYIPSSFAGRSSNYIENLLTKKIITPSFIPNSPASDIRDPRIRNVIINRFILDSIRAIIAHEVGHTLGIKHNFAGNLFSNTTSKTYLSIFDDYILNDNINIDNIKISSTVMDYLSTSDTALLGALIRKQQNQGLAYDKWVINFGYLDLNQTPSEKELKELIFCGDSEQNDPFNVDCKISDRFANPLENIKFNMQEQISELASTFILKFLYLKKSSTIDRMSAISHTSFSPIEDAVKIVNITNNFLNILSDKAKFYFDKKENDFLSDFNDDFNDRENLRKNFLFEGLENIDGFNSIIFDNFTPTTDSTNKYRLPIIENIKQKIKEGIDNLYKSSCTQKEFQKLNLLMESYINILESDLLKLFITNFTKNLNSNSNYLFAISDSKISEFYKGLSKFSEAILFFKKQTTTGFQEYYFNTNLRKEIINLINFNFYPLNKSHKLVLLKHIKEVHLSDLSKKNELINDLSISNEIKQKITDQIIFEKELFFPL
ncbi:MAG: zinc-dependent metalloprotease [Oligoflexia bacterium]|nr:zinc-dependent metalloprotease [Oligoflexia bacterium]